MNIDTSSLNANTETAAYMASSNNRKVFGGTTFSSQLKTLQVDAKASSETVKNETDNDSAMEQENTPNIEGNEVDNKVEEKNENKTSEQKSELENEQTGQHSQNQNGQQDANQQTTELSDEILSVIKANKGNLSGGVNNFKIISGISEDVFASPAKIDYSSFAMSNEDALFFANLVSKTEMNMQSVAGEFQKSLQAGKVEQVQKTAQVSSVLLEALSESMKTNKAFRIDFDNDVSVVLRVDRDGNLNANFIPGDKAVEAYLRNNIPYLKQRFEEQNLSYGELTYSKHKRQDQDDEKQNNKENSHE